MKTAFSILALACLLTVNRSIATAQDFSFNQNIQVQKEFKNGEKFNCSNGNSYVLEMIPLHKDMTGNTGYLLMFKGKTDTLYFAPDNPYFPLVYRGIRGKVWGNAHYSIEENGYVILQKTIGSVTVESQPDNPSHPKWKTSAIYSGSNMDPNFTFFLTQGKGGKAGAAFEKAVQHKRVHYGGGMLTQSITHVGDYIGLKEFYTYQRKFIDSLFTNRTIENYRKELAKTLIQKEYYVVYTYTNHGSSNYGRDGKIRLTPTLNSKGEVEKLVMQTAYVDGNFYDKEKFFFDLPMHSTGRFQFRDVSGITLVPILGRILLYTENSSNYYICSGFISPYPMDMFAYNLLSMSFSMVPQSEAQWCKEELEESYNTAKDKYIFEKVFNNYLKRMMSAK